LVLRFSEAGIGQGDEPLDLDLHAAVHQAVFGQQRAQRRDLGGVAAVEGREGGQGGEGHRGGVLGGNPILGGAD
jgi:hypothetical protein